ncbi:MAG TPA: hypothetical protein VFK26_09505 [Gemmatimonadaceae bacterium]|nr:hypothetical protein [Gemmatimonadaceae bacterium]
MTRLISAAALAFAVAACTTKTETSSDTSALDTTNAVGTPAGGGSSQSPAATQPPANTSPVPGTTPPPSTSTDTTRPPASTSFRITPNSFGPLRVGMTVAQAASAMGGGFTAPRGYDGGCGYATLTKAPAGLAVMLEGGKIARFEVRSGDIKTAEGAGIGDSETRIKGLYGSTVASTPHKYVQGGHYLTVKPSSSSTNRIVFETDGSKVTEYRSGKIPEVEQVERCG